MTLSLHWSLFRAPWHEANVFDFFRLNFHLFFYFKDNKKANAHLQWIALIIMTYQYVGNQFNGEKGLSIACLLSSRAANVYLLLVACSGNGELIICPKQLNLVFLA